MNFFCFSFALNQKYRAANLLRLIVAISVPKYALSKTGSKITILTMYEAFKVAVFTVLLLLRRNTFLLPIRPYKVNYFGRKMFFQKRNLYPSNV